MIRKRISTKKIAVILCMVLCMVTFLAPVTQTTAASGIHLSDTKVTMYAGENGGVVLLDGTGESSAKCKWEVSKSGILKGEASGPYYFFTALKKGKTTLTCISGGKKYKCKITVKSIRKKSDLKVLASYKNENGDKIQLIRVKNRTKSKKTISLYQKEGDFMKTWYAVPGGKSAYFIRNTSYKNYANVYRVNAKVGINTDSNPGKNITSKVKAKIKIGKDNSYKITYKNKAKRYANICATYVLYDKNGNPIYMNYDYVSVEGNSKTSNTYTCPTETKAVRGEVYINAVAY